MAAPGPNPVVVEVTRGDAVESVHRGAVAVLRADGTDVFVLGDIARPIYPRSAVKPLQAMALLESGAARRYRLGDEEIALACASHGGESFHTERVALWLQRLGLSVTDLECGAHAPYYLPAAQALAARGEAPSALHNNCSGKHSGFLSVARHLGIETRGYLERSHPTQQAWERVLAELADVDTAAAPAGVDGCGIPVLAVPLRALALALARFAAPTGLGSARSQAIERIQQAMRRAPRMVAGSGRFCTAVMEQAGHSVLVKTGAEGVFVAALPARGIGVALKIDDGATRAAEVAIGAVLRSLEAFDARAWHELRARVYAPLHNVAGRTVGALQPRASLQFAA